MATSCLEGKNSGKSPAGRSFGKEQELKSTMNRILVTDDERNHLKAINRLFMGHGYVMEFAQNGHQALKKVHDFSPDVVLLDIMMPGIDGYEVCRRLKSDGKTSAIMVLLLSAKSSIDDRLKGYEVGADDYIVKPYDPEELRAKVRILFRLKKAQDELRVLNQNLEKMVEVKTRELVKKERQAIVGQMVQGIIHNLQGPMTVAKGRVEMALRGFRELSEVPEEASDGFQKSVEAVVRNLKKASEAVEKTEILIQSLLLKSSQEAAEGKRKLKLNDLIVKELNFLDADLFFKHGIKKNLRLDPDVPDITGIYSDFSQVIYNLIKNASDAMRDSAKKELTISTRQDEQNIYVEFQDTGIGISDQHLERIFDPFFTTKAVKSNKDSEDPAGSGLGLHVCSQLMKHYGAKISVKSKPGAGSTFTLTVPKSIAEAIG